MEGDSAGGGGTPTIAAVALMETEEVTRFCRNCWVLERLPIAVVPVPVVELVVGGVLLLLLLLLVLFLS